MGVAHIKLEKKGVFAKKLKPKERKIRGPLCGNANKTFAHFVNGMDQTKKKQEEHFLEEDDEFEEFEEGIVWFCALNEENWTKVEEEEDADLQWADDWDDETIDDSFAKQLR